MAYKTIRNNVLRDMHRLISVSYGDEVWASPDGYFCIKHNIYDGYRTKKGQEVPPQIPSLDKLIENGNFGAYVKVHHEKIVDNGEEEHKTTELTSDKSEHVYRIRSIYLDLFKELYPKLELHAPLAVNTKPYYAPIKVISNGEFVGLIMQVKL